MADEKIEGVYFEEKILTGGLREQIRYWAREDADGSIVLEYLKLSGKSTGMEAERLAREAFEKRFAKDEPKEDAAPGKSAEEVQRERLVREGQLHLEREEFHSAEFEFKKALRIDEGDVEAGFGLGESFVGQGRVEEAKGIFSRLADNDLLYLHENKHTFNKLGITLRKQGMYAQAVKSYERAIQIDHEDPVLFFNLAHALYHMKELEKAATFLENALAIQPDFEKAAELLAFLRRKARR